MGLTAAFLPAPVLPGPVETHVKRRRGRQALGGESIVSEPRGRLTLRRLAHGPVFGNGVPSADICLNGSVFVPLKSRSLPQPCRRDEGKRLCGCGSSTSGRCLIGKT